MTKNAYFFFFLLVTNAMPSIVAYIDDSMMRKYSTSYDPATMWSPRTSGVIRPKTVPDETPSRSRTRIVPISPPTKTSQLHEVKTVPPPSPSRGAVVARFDVNEIIRAEYDAWCFRYSKTKEDNRFQIFKSNFMKQMDFNLKTGKFFLLNEYGDMTSEEYEAKVALKMKQNQDIKTVGDLGDDVINSVLNQVMDTKENEKVKGKSHWGDSSFAMDIEDETEESDDIVELITMEDEEENDDEEEAEFDDDRYESFMTEFEKTQEDAPVEEETHRIFSMGSSAPKAASPEVQSSRFPRTNNKQKQPATVKKGGFAVAVASLFGTVAPMGSSVGSRKNIME